MNPYDLCHCILCGEFTTCWPQVAVRKVLMFCAECIASNDAAELLAIIRGEDLPPTGTGGNIMTSTPNASNTSNAPNTPDTQQVGLTRAAVRRLLLQAEEDAHLDALGEGLLNQGLKRVRFRARDLLLIGNALIDLRGLNLRGVQVVDGILIKMGPVGSRADELVALFGADGTDAVHTGCFKGSLDEFARSVADNYHAATAIGKYYRAVVRFLSELRVLTQEYAPERGA